MTMENYFIKNVPKAAEKLIKEDEENAIIKKLLRCNRKEILKELRNMYPEEFV